MQAPEVEFGDVITQCTEVIRSHLSLILVTLFLITAGYALLDLAPNKGAGGIPRLIVGVIAQYHFVEALLPEGAEATPGGKRKYRSLFVTGFLGGLGILIGGVLLILPGVYLMALWAIATPLVVAEGMNGIDALKASWHATSNARWPLFFVFLTCIAALAVPFFIFGFGTAALNLKQDRLALSFARHFLVSLWTVGGWILGVGIYRCLKPSLGGLAGVFA
jgi:hypothetical protein